VLPILGWLVEYHSTYSKVNLETATLSPTPLDLNVSCQRTCAQKMTKHGGEMKKSPYPCGVGEPSVCITATDLDIAICNKLTSQNSGEIWVLNTGPRTTSVDTCWPPGNRVAYRGEPHLSCCWMGDARLAGCTGHPTIHIGFVF